MELDVGLLVTTIGWLLALGATVTTAPQAIRVIRHREVAGVSVATTIAGIATMTAWTLYTVELRDIPAVASSLGPLVAWSTTLVAVAAINRQPRLILLGLVVAMITAALSVGGLAKMIAVTGSLLWTLPQLRVVLQGKDLRGVSAVAYTLIAVENAGWVIYAAGTGTWAYAIAPLVQSPAAAVIAWRTARSHATIMPDHTTASEHKVTARTTNHRAVNSTEFS
jgi:uncharacterized protein with PQ loop repeat